MKKTNILLVFIFLLSLAGCNQETAEDFNEEEKTKPVETLQMQWWELEVPREYECEWWFTMWYRYDDAECLPNYTDNYKIIADFGLAASAVDESYMPAVDSRAYLRSGDLDADCILLNQMSKEIPMYLDAEHYVCNHFKDWNENVTLGIVKSFGEYSRDFEVRLVILDDKYENIDYLEILTDFANQAISIDWNDFTDN